MMPSERRFQAKLPCCGVKVTFVRTRRVAILPPLARSGKALPILSAWE